MFSESSIFSYIKRAAVAEIPVLTQKKEICMFAD